jgi:hypothetical protein
MQLYGQDSIQGQLSTRHTSAHPMATAVLDQLKLLGFHEA